MSGDPKDSENSKEIHDFSRVYLDEKENLSSLLSENSDASKEELIARIEKLEKINNALIQQVERNMNQRATGYSLFQSAVLLEEQVRARTNQLRSALNELETSNADLSKAKEQAELSDRSKTRFLAAASHDLLQPLSFARLNMSALKLEKVSTEVGRLIGKVDRSLLTIEELLRTLFDISKLDAGVSVPDICLFSADRLLQGLVEDFQGLANTKGVSLKIRPCPFIVESDPIFLRRILQNLISNALRYTNTGGVLVGARRRGNMLRFEVWDTGIGIAEKESAKIFDEFHRGERNGNHDGLGLGLAIVQRMGRAVGHEIDFRSVQGKGSVFSVTVPISTGAVASDDREFTTKVVDAPVLYQLEDAFILLIEDDPEIADALQRLFNKWGAYCLSGDCWPSIRNKLDSVERAPDLIAADYHLADQTVGPEVVQHIRELYKDSDGREIPAIIVTATPTAEIKDEAAATACEFLTKPVEPAELRALMIHLLNKQE